MSVSLRTGGTPGRWSCEACDDFDCYFITYAADRFDCIQLAVTKASSLGHRDIAIQDADLDISQFVIPVFEMLCPNGHGFDIVSKAMFEWDVCEVCGEKASKNPDYVPDSFPAVFVPGGATFAPSPSPEVLKKRHAAQVRQRKLDILKEGKGTIVERDLAIEKIKFEERTDEIRDGRLSIEVPRLLDAQLKPEIPLQYHAIGPVKKSKAKPKAKSVA